MTQFLVHYGIIALLLISFVKGVGVPLPIPADLVILVAATGSASGKLVLWQAVLAVFGGMVAGSVIQYTLVRGPARSVLYRFGGHVGLTPHRLNLAFRRVENVGVFGVAVAVVTPAIRTAAIPACGIVRVPAKIFVSGLALGTGAYIAFQFFVAYGVVKLALHVWTHGDKVWLWLLLIPVAAILGTLVYRHRTVHLPPLQGSLTQEDAALRSRLCPLCRFTVLADTASHSNHTDDSRNVSGPPRHQPSPSPSKGG